MKRQVFHKPAVKNVAPLHKMQLMELRNKITKQATRDSVIALLGISAYVLHNDFGFGHKRLVKVTDLLLEHLKMFEAGEVTMDDYRNILKEECDIDSIEM